MILTTHKIIVDKPIVTRVAKVVNGEVAPPVRSSINMPSSAQGSAPSLKCIGQSSSAECKIRHQSRIPKDGKW